MNSVWFISACIQKEIPRKIECNILELLVRASPVRWINYTRAKHQIPNPRRQAWCWHLYCTPLWLKTRNAVPVLALLVLALASKEGRFALPGLLTHATVHMWESGSHQFISTDQYLIHRAGRIQLPLNLERSELWFRNIYLVLVVYYPLAKQILKENQNNWSICSSSNAWRRTTYFPKYLS